MGKRLGDCTTVNKTMAVVINGGAPITVTFNADYTASSDATILAVINAALGANGTASVYDVVAGDLPSFPDRVTARLNNETTTIKRWSAVKADASGVKIMGTADAAALFYGVAVEPILPGQVGRILRHGRLQSAAQILGVTGTIALGAAIYHDDATAGRFATAGTRQAMVGAHTAGWAEF